MEVKVRDIIHGIGFLEAREANKRLYDAVFLVSDSVLSGEAISSWLKMSVYNAYVDNCALFGGRFIYQRCEAISDIDNLLKKFRILNDFGV